MTDVNLAPETLNLHTHYDYDEVGDRTMQVDANQHTTRFAYDSLGRRTSRTLPLGQTESYTYESNGNLSTRTDFNGKTTSYAYDALNRLLSKTPDATFNSAPVTFTYTATGKRQTMSDPSGQTVYTYDDRDRLQSKQTPFGTLSYTYDNAGDVLSITSSNAGGVSVTYSYDQLNRPASVTAANQTSTYGYDAVGNLATVAYPNGMTTSYTYNLLNRLTQVAATTNSTALAAYAYMLGPAGNRTGVVELNGRSVGYGYDDVYRLTSESITALTGGTFTCGTGGAKCGAVGYSYDAVGNRQQMTSTLGAIPAGMWNYDANDRLATDTYDNAGDTVNSAGIQNQYDFENHLIQHGAVTVVYDGDGNRVAETVGGVTTNYLVDTQNPTGYAGDGGTAGRVGGADVHLGPLVAVANADDQQYACDQLLRLRRARLGALPDRRLGRGDRHVRLRRLRQPDQLHRYDAEQLPVRRRAVGRRTRAVLQPGEIPEYEHGQILDDGSSWRPH